METHDTHPVTTAGRVVDMDDPPAGEPPPGLEFRVLFDQAYGPVSGAFARAIERLPAHDPYQVIYLQAELTRLFNQGPELLQPDHRAAQAEWWALASKLRSGVGGLLVETVGRLGEIRDRFGPGVDDWPAPSRPMGLNPMALARTRLEDTYGRLDRELRDDASPSAGKPLIHLEKGLVLFPSDGGRQRTLFRELAMLLREEFEREPEFGGPTIERADFLRRAAPLLGPFFPPRFTSTHSKGRLASAYGDSF